MAHTPYSQIKHPKLWELWYILLSMGYMRDLYHQRYYIAPSGFLCLPKLRIKTLLNPKP